VTLSADEILAGGSLTHEVEVPAELLAGNGHAPVDPRVVVRPLTVRDLQRIAKAAQGDDELSAALILQHALVEPELELEQVTRLPAGLARFLVDRVNDLSGVSTPRDALEELVQAPLARACFILAKEFGWTPEEVSGMTVGQILLYLEMSHREGEAA
jgi:hypothetical protein